jgi:hypothetical protein
MRAAQSVIERVKVLQARSIYARVFAGSGVAA